MLMILWELFMADETPSGDRAVFVLCEGIALFCATQAMQRMLDGRPLFEIVIAWVLCVSFFIIGIKWSKIKLKITPRLASHVNRIATDPRYWMTAIMLVFFYFAISGIIYLRSLRNDLDTYVMPRTVTTEQADQLREYLSGYEAHAVTVKINSPDAEAQEYGRKLFNALKTTDWEVNLDLEIDAPNSSKGLCIRTQGQDAKPKNTKTDSIEILTEGLRRAKIQANCGQGSGGGEYKLSLVVGRRPLAIKDEPWTGKFIKWLYKKYY